MGRMIVAATLLALGPGAAAADESLARIRALLDAQPRLRAEFDQTRRSAELERPVLAHGRMLVWREAGVLWQLFPTDTAAGIRSRLDGAVDDLGPAGRDQSFGFGRVNLCKAAGGGC